MGALQFHQLAGAGAGWLPQHLLNERCTCQYSLFNVNLNNLLIQVKFVAVCRSWGLIDVLCGLRNTLLAFDAQMLLLLLPCPFSSS